MKRKQNNFGAKYGNGWISNMEKALEELEEGPKAKIHLEKPRTILKKLLN